MNSKKKESMSSFRRLALIVAFYGRCWQREMTRALEIAQTLVNERLDYGLQLWMFFCATTGWRSSRLSSFSAAKMPRLLTFSSLLTAENKSISPRGFMTDNFGFLLNRPGCTLWSKSHFELVFAYVCAFQFMYTNLLLELNLGHIYIFCEHQSK